LSNQPAAIKWNPFCDQGGTPTPRQKAFLACNHYREGLFGGQAGGGKSSALLMAALQYAEVPGYSALLLRRTYADLALPGALMDRAGEWLQPTAASWNSSTKTWHFPSGATITFGYLENEKSKYRYQGSELQYIAWDELTQFPLSVYTYLFSRLRKTRGGHLDNVPLRVRAGSNPGGEGHAWVYERFIVGATENARTGRRLFIPASLLDNPHVDAQSYTESLAELDEVTKAQLLQGLWITDPARRPFDAEWWRRSNRYHAHDYRMSAQVVARYLSWDTAYKDGDGNDWSACTVGELTSDYRLLIREVWKGKLTFPHLPEAIAETAHRYNHDGKLRSIIIEDKGSGTSAIQTLQHSMPRQYADMIVPFRPTTDKMQRARQTAVWCKRGGVWMPWPTDEVSWLYDFMGELTTFPDAVHDDQVDSFTQLVLFTEHLIAAGWQARGGDFSDDDSR
jgi:predicted phage terminase large subunit-like protein